MSTNEIKPESTAKIDSLVKDRDDFCFALGLLMTFWGVLLAAITCGPRGVAKSIKGLLVGLVIVVVCVLLLMILPPIVVITFGSLFGIFYLIVCIVILIESGERIGYGRASDNISETHV